MNSNLTHSLQNFRPKLDFEQQQGIFTSVERTIRETRFIIETLGGLK